MSDQPKPSDQPKHGEKDRVYKQFYSFAEVVEEVVVEFVGPSVGGDWIDDLDFDTLEQMPTEFVDAESETVRLVDMAWRVRFRSRPLWLVVLFEFQSTEDKAMATRALLETALCYQSLTEGRGAGAEGEESAVLFVVVKSFEGRWKAAKGASLDLRKVGRVRAGLALRAEVDPERVVQALTGLDKQLDTPELRDAWVAWLRRQMIDWGVPAEIIEQLDTLKEVGRVYGNRFAAVEKHALARGEARGQELGEARGKKLGEALGEAQGLRRAYVETAKWKFGADAAERLARVLAEVTDRARLARLGRLVVECETGDELIARAAGD